MNNDIIRNKLYYMVKNLSNANDCVVVATGTIGADNYSACKVDAEAANPLPVGDSVIQYNDDEEFRAAIGLAMFNAGITSDYMLAKEDEFCRVISESFRVANDGLTIAAGEVLFAELESASHAISRGLVNIAWSRFNATDDLIVTPAMKAQFNALFEDFFDRYPRDLS